MKIIHVGSHAGVPGILAKYQRETHDVELVYKDLDILGGRAVTMDIQDTSRPLTRWCKECVCGDTAGHQRR